MLGVRCRHNTSGKTSRDVVAVPAETGDLLWGQGPTLERRFLLRSSSLRQSLITVPNSARQATSTTQQDLLQLADILSLLHFIRRHKTRLIISVAMAIALAAIYLVNCPRLHESNSELLVVKKNPLVVQGMPSAVLRGVDAMSTHIAVITSPWLAARAMSDDRLSGMETFAGKDRPVESLTASLNVLHENAKVRGYSDSNVLRFSFRGPHPHECKDILNAVIDAYRQYLNESSQADNRDASTLIAQKADQIRLSLENKEREYKAFRKTAPKPSTSDRDNLLVRQRLANLDSSRVALEIRRAETTSRISDWRKATRNGEITNAARAMLPESLKPKWNLRLEETLIPLLVQEQGTISALGMGANHPKNRALREKVALARKLFSTSGAQQQESSGAETSVAQSNASDAVAEYTFKLDQELAGIMAAEKSLQKEFDRVQVEMKQELERERNEARALAEFELTSEQYDSAIARDQQLHDALLAQLHRVEIDIVSGAYSTTLIAPPSNAQQVSPRTLLVFSISIVLGIAGGFAYGLTNDVSNRNYDYSTQEAAQPLNAPVLGRIPPLSSIGAPVPRRFTPPALDPVLCTNRSPDSSVAEAYRGLRTAVIFKAGNRPLKTIVIASPNVGDGASTLAANLAASFAQSGREVLLIDGDLHSPCIHQVFDVSNNQGLATVLSGDCALDDAISKCGIAGLSILPSGPPPTRPADLLSAPNFNEALSVLRKRFDYVLIDTPGMLAVPDAQILAAKSDGVLLTIRCGRNGGPALARAEDMLEQSGADVLGVVLTDSGPYDPTMLGDRADSRNGVADQVASVSV